MSRHNVGKLTCLLTLIVVLGWSQAAVAGTPERDRLEKALRRAKNKLLRIDRSIGVLEVKIRSAKTEVQRREAILKKSDNKKNRQALLKALARLQHLAQALEGARASRALLLARIQFLKAKLLALRPAPRLGPRLPRAGRTGARSEGGATGPSTANNWCPATGRATAPSHMIGL